MTIFGRFGKKKRKDASTVPTNIEGEQSVLSEGLDVEAMTALRYITKPNPDADQTCIWGMLNKQHALGNLSKDEAFAIYILGRAALLKYALVKKEYRLEDMIDYDNAEALMISLLSQGKNGWLLSRLMRRMEYKVSEKGGGGWL